MAFAKDAAVRVGPRQVGDPRRRRRMVLDVFDSREKAHGRLLQIAIMAGKLKWRLHTRASVMLLGTAESPEKAADQVKSVRTGSTTGRTPSSRPSGGPRDRAGACLDHARVGLAMGAAALPSSSGAARGRPTTSPATASRGPSRTSVSSPDARHRERPMGMDARRTTPLGIALRLPRAEQRVRRPPEGALALDFVGLANKVKMVAKNLAWRPAAAGDRPRWPGRCSSSTSRRRHESRRASSSCT
jgi:hypothetical protein